MSCYSDIDLILYLELWDSTVIVAVYNYSGCVRLNWLLHHHSNWKTMLLVL